MKDRKNIFIIINVIASSQILVSLNNIVDKSNRKAMNRNWSNQKANPALKTKTHVFKNSCFFFSNFSDFSRHWQIQKLADPAGCSDTDQLGWMLIKEPRNNGTCSWDIKQGKVKPYFLYNTQTMPDNPGIHYVFTLLLF